MSLDPELEDLKKQAYEAIDSQDPYSQKEVDAITNLMLIFSMNDIDFKMAEALCQRFIQSTDKDLSHLAILCVSHIARVYHRKVNSRIMKEIHQIHQDQTHQNWGEVDLVLDLLNVIFK